MWTEALKIAGTGVLVVFVTLFFLAFIAWLIGKLSFAISRTMEVESVTSTGIDRKRKIAAITAAIRQYEKGE